MLVVKPTLMSFFGCSGCFCLLCMIPALSLLCLVNIYARVDKKKINKSKKRMS